MLQYSTYSVISPEGCASILWKSADRAQDAAEAMGITAKRLKELELIDEIIDEPLGGAHRNPEQMAATLKSRLVEELNELTNASVPSVVMARQEKLRQIGHFKEA